MILDLTDPERSDIRYKRMTFPDGQPHFELGVVPEMLAGLDRIEVLCRIKSAADIADVGLAVDTITASGTSVSVNVAYMLGARMDRPMGPSHPYTLKILARMLSAAVARADAIRVLDPHSEKTLDLLSWGHKVEAIHPDRLVHLALGHFDPGATIVIPDEGAVSRTIGIVERLGLTNPIARCVKERDSATGKLSGFALVDGKVAGRSCLIVDDLCDGGGTFSGIAGVLRAAGAWSVGLCVTHGIFSKGPAIEGITVTYTTDSFQPLSSLWGLVPTPGSWGFLSLCRPEDGRALVHVLRDFLRDHLTAEVDQDA
jgi:ribose-phosphate pyrophosphokinase